MARFVGKEEAIVFNMGYATNSTTIPALVRHLLTLFKNKVHCSSRDEGRRLSRPINASGRHA